MKVLVACESSGVVRDAFIATGHDAWSCDLLPSETPGPHLQCDVRDVLGNGWDLMIGHPPCTRLCNSGVRWLAERDLWGDLNEAVDFFLSLWNAPINEICLENPVQHSHARARIGVPPTQIIQPWMFGHGETKATCLWLKRLPRLTPTNIVDGRENRIHLMPPSEDRWKERSRTYTGIAAAMASQWGKTAHFRSLPPIQHFKQLSLITE